MLRGPLPIIPSTFAPAQKRDRVTKEHCHPASPRHGLQCVQITFLGGYWHKRSSETKIATFKFFENNVLHLTNAQAKLRAEGVPLAARGKTASGVTEGAVSFSL